MDRKFSVRASDKTLNQISALALRLGITKRKVIEKALLEYAKKMEGKKKARAASD